MKSLLLFSFLLVSLVGHSQQLTLLKVVPLPFVPALSSIDQSGNFYLVSDRGLVVKYDAQGDSLMAYSPRKNSPVSIFDAHSSLRPFVFYEDFQEFTFLDQFLTTDKLASFYPDLVGFASYTAVSSDNNIWLIDDVDFSLKKYNTLSNTLESVTPLNIVLNAEEYDVMIVREYQNKLFILDASQGLFVFDTFGSLQKKMALSVPFLNFFKDDAYYIKDGYIVSMNIYSGNKIGLPLPNTEKEKDISNILRGTDTYYFVGRELKIYTLERAKK